MNEWWPAPLPGTHWSGNAERMLARNRAAGGCSRRRLRGPDCSYRILTSTTVWKLLEAVHWRVSRHPTSGGVNPSVQTTEVKKGCNPGGSALRIRIGILTATIHRRTFGWPQPKGAKYWSRLTGTYRARFASMQMSHLCNFTEASNPCTAKTPIFNCIRH
jgi:hypothetical protein